MMSIVNNCMLYLLEIGCLVLVSPLKKKKKKQKPELLTRACKEEEEKSKGKRIPPAED